MSPYQAAKPKEPYSKTVPAHTYKELHKKKQTREMNQLLALLLSPTLPVPEYTTAMNSQ